MPTIREPSSGSTVPTPVHVVTTFQGFTVVLKCYSSAGNFESVGIPQGPDNLVHFTFALPAGTVASFLATDYTNNASGVSGITVYDPGDENVTLKASVTAAERAKSVLAITGYTITPPDKRACLTVQFEGTSPTEGRTDYYLFARLVAETEAGVAVEKWAGNKQSVHAWSFTTPNGYVTLDDNQSLSAIVELWHVAPGDPTRKLQLVSTVRKVLMGTGV